MKNKRFISIITLSFVSLFCGACTTAKNYSEAPALPNNVANMATLNANSVQNVQKALYQPEQLPTLPTKAAYNHAPYVPAARMAGSDLIAPQDLLEITVFKVADLSRTLRVGNDGHVSIPLIGRVKASGLKPSQLERKIAALLNRSYMHGAQVTVLVTESSQNRITVEGQVNKPGVFPVSGSVSMLQAIALAGGLTEQADSQRALLLRKGRNGRAQQQMLNLSAIRQGRMRDPLLMQDDRIIVQKGTLNRFTVNGAVNAAGMFPLQPGMTLLQALASAGGLSPKADKGQAIVFRRTPQGIRRFQVNLTSIMQGQSSDPFLQADDRIMVRASRSRQMFEDATRILSPITLF